MQSLGSEKNAGPSNHIYKADFSSLFLLSQTIDRNRTFLGSIHSGCRFLTEIIQYLIGMIAGDTEFANYILHRDISLLLANLHNVGKLLIRLLRSKFHIPILATATVRTTFQSFQEFLRTCFCDVKRPATLRCAKRLCSIVPPLADGRRSLRCGRTSAG